MRKNFDQLMRTKRYRKLLKLYGSTEDKKKRKYLAGQLMKCKSSMMLPGIFAENQ